MTHKFLTLSHSRQIEEDAQKRGLNLMDLAGDAIVQYTANLTVLKNKNILILIGNGNNGGDGVTAAIKLKSAGYNVVIFAVTPNPNNVTKHLLEKYRNVKGKILLKLPTTLTKYALIIDAVFGVGLTKELDVKTVSIFDFINKNSSYTLAVDTPSGLDPFSGQVYHGCIKADATLSFISDKVGLHTGKAIDYVGQVQVEPLIDLDTYKLRDIATIEYALNELKHIEYTKLIRRKQNTNKGDFGVIGIIGGGNGMYGALLLAGRAAMQMGGGKVVLGFHGDDYPQVDYQMPELIITQATKIFKNIENYSVLVIGPGLGVDAKALKLLTKIIELKTTCKMIFDADALNLLALHQDLQVKFAQIPDKILTPHPKEAARALSIELQSVQQNRFTAVCLLQSKYNCCVLLKGAGSLLCNKNNIVINTSGSCALSNAGQGDALCGIIASLIGQGLESFEALKLAVYLQGTACDELVSINQGYHGILASDITVYAKKILNQLMYTKR